MSHIAVDKNNDEWIFDGIPKRQNNEWYPNPIVDEYISLPKGSIEKLIGKKLTWEDEPVELKEEKLTQSTSCNGCKYDNDSLSDALNNCESCKRYYKDKFEEKDS